VTLTAEELAVVESLASPIAFDQRAAFVNTVAQALAGSSPRGPGAAHRLAAAVRLTFVKTSNSVPASERHAAEALGKGARHAATPAGVTYGKGVMRF
jgi:hypothetical protein